MFLERFFRQLAFSIFSWPYTVKSVLNLITLIGNIFWIYCELNLLIKGTLSIWSHEPNESLIRDSINWHPVYLPNLI
jgi:hypothetical protein